MSFNPELNLRSESGCLRMKLKSKGFIKDGVKVVIGCLLWGICTVSASVNLAISVDGPILTELCSTLQIRMYPTCLRPKLVFKSVQQQSVLYEQVAGLAIL